MLYLQVCHLQRVHVQTDDIGRRGEAVAWLHQMTELGLGEKLLQCKRPAGRSMMSFVHPTI